MLQGGDGVSRFARLRQRDDERIRHRHTGAITVFRCDFNIHRDAGNVLDPIARHHCGVITGATGENQNILGVSENVIGLSTKQQRADGLCATDHLQCVGHHLRLLKRFFLHVMRKQPQTHRVCGQLAGVNFTLNKLTRDRTDAVRIQSNFNHITFFKVHHFARFRQQSRSVRSQIVATFAHTNQQRRAVTCANDVLWLIGTHDGDRVQTFESFGRLINGFVQVQALNAMLMNQMGHDLSVCVRCEHIACRSQFNADFIMVFNDAIVHQAHADAFAVADHRMGIAQCWRTMRGPARMGNANGRFNVLLIDLRFKLSHTFK